MRGDGMEKGKVKEEKKYLSIMLVPHFSGKMKVLKLSTPYSRLLGMVAVALISMLCMCFLSIYTVNQNQKLQKSVLKLSELNVEQKNLINEKSEEIEELKQKRVQADKSASEYVEKYKEILEKYISPRANRSGDRNESSFIQDVSELKELLNNIGQFTTDSNFSVDGLSETENKLKEYIAAIPTLWPATGRISSKFGDREDPFLINSKFHSGIDIAANYGEDIKASGNGTVTFAGTKGDYGKCVFIDHGHGLTTVYGHTSQYLVKEGQAVRKGDVIAKVGSTGRSTGPHLHFEVRLDGNVVDPLKYLDKK